MEEQRMKKAIFSSLSILDAWKDGRIRITEDKDDIANHQYSINTIINILENNLLEGVNEQTKIVEKGKNSYEIFKSIQLL